MLVLGQDLPAVPSSLSSLSVTRSIRSMNCSNISRKSGGGSFASRRRARSGDGSFASRRRSRPGGGSFASRRRDCSGGGVWYACCSARRSVLPCSACGLVLCCWVGRLVGGSGGGVGSCPSPLKYLTSRRAGSGGGGMPDTSKYSKSSRGPFLGPLVVTYTERVAVAEASRPSGFRCRTMTCCMGPLRGCSSM